MAGVASISHGALLSHGEPSQADASRETPLLQKHRTT
jgi:hypothetical protein